MQEMEIYGKDRQLARQTTMKKTGDYLLSEAGITNLNLRDFFVTGIEILNVLK